MGHTRTALLQPRSALFPSPSRSSLSGSDAGASGANTGVKLMGCLQTCEHGALHSLSVPGQPALAAQQQPCKGAPRSAAACCGPTSSPGSASAHTSCCGRVAQGTSEQAAVIPRQTCRAETFNQKAAAWVLRHAHLPLHKHGVNSGSSGEPSTRHILRRRLPLISMLQPCLDLKIKSACPGAHLHVSSSSSSSFAGAAGTSPALILLYPCVRCARPRSYLPVSALVWCSPLGHSPADSCGSCQGTRTPVADGAELVSAYGEAEPRRGSSQAKEEGELRSVCSVGPTELPN